MPRLQPNTSPDEAWQQAGLTPVDPAHQGGDKDGNKEGRRPKKVCISVEEHLAGLWKVLGLGD